MSEPQLERSVLEAKEREELFAIANALGTKPTSRLRKSELVTQILRATGVEEGVPDEEPRVRRSRASKPAAPGEQLFPDASGPSATAATRTLGEDGARGAPGIPGTAAATATPAGEPATTGSDGRGGPVGQGRSLPRAATAAPGSSRAARPPAPTAGAVGSGPAGAGLRGDGDDRPERASASGSPPAPAAGAADRPGAAVGAETRSAGTSEAAAPADASAEEPAEVGRDAEAASRRGRRRRGRERGERTDRELPGQSPDQPFTGEPAHVAGLVDLREDGYGFVRTTGSVAGPSDVYVSISQVRRFALRRGDHIEGGSRPATGNEKYPALVRIDTIGGLPVEEARNRPRFEGLTPAFPDQRLRLDRSEGDDLVARVVDLVAPIGKGQRGLVVSPPGTGKTTLLSQVGAGIEANHPEVELLVVVVDERPEEVVELRSQLRSEVVASGFDRPAEEHVQAAELTVERARRAAESGRDVVVLLDGLSRLARAYELALAPGGRVGSGGVDSATIYSLKRILGAARKLEEGGSLTLLATVAAGSASTLDEVVLGELAGIANLQLNLDRSLAARHLHPAIDPLASATRHEERLRSSEQMAAVTGLRRSLGMLCAGGDPAPGIEALVERVRSTADNDELLAGLAGNPLVSSD